MTLSKCIVLALILTMITSSQPVGSLTPQVKYVQPFNEVSACTSESCTFDQFAQNPEQYFLSGTTFIFLPGDHQLNNSISLHGVQNISFQGMSVKESVTIRFGPQVGLSFDDCNGIEIKSLNLLLSGDFEYRIMFSDTNNVNIHNVMIREENKNSIGCSAIVSKASVVNISDSSFLDIRGQSGAVLVAFNSSLVTFTGSNSFSNNSAKLGGGIHSVGSTLQFIGPGVASFINNAAVSNENDTYTPCFNNVFSNYNGLGGAVLAENSRVIISGCAQFVGNIATYRGGAIAATNSSTIVIDGSLCFNGLYPMTVLFDGNRVTNSLDPSLDITSGCGGAIFTNDCDHVNMTNVSLTNNFAPGVGGSLHFNRSNVIRLYNINAVNNTVNLYYGGAISVFLCSQALIDGDNYFINNAAHTFAGAIDVFLVDIMKISGTNYFQENVADNGGAIDIYTVMMTLVCGNNVFRGNSAVNGGAIFMYNASVVHVCGTNIFMEGVADQGGALYIEISTVLFNGTNNTILFNSNNATGTSGGGAVVNLDSQAMLFGSIQFKKNSATAGNGGAMALYGTSRVALNPLSTVDFLDNYALLDGGAIYFEDSFASRLNCYVIKAECFIVLNTTYTSLDTALISLNFTNNSAGRYGTVFYGGQLGRCNLLFQNNTINGTCGESTMEMQENSYEIMKNLTKVDDENSIALPPERLCLCNNKLHCTSVLNDTLSLPKELAPGQIFGIEMLARDQRDFNVPGIRVLNNPHGKSYPLSQVTNDILTTSLSCRNFTYRLLVESTKTNPSYDFYISGLCGRNRGHVNLSITLKPCPVGFKFSTKERMCVCTNILKAFSTIECDIDNNSINKRSRNNFWINIADDYFLIYEGSCPLDYCNDNSKVVTIAPNEPDV